MLVYFQDIWIDTMDDRLLTCRHCGHVGPESHFVYWGGDFGINIGVCRKKTCINKQYLETIKKVEERLNDRG